VQFDRRRTGNARAKVTWQGPNQLEIASGGNRLPGRGRAVPMIEKISYFGGIMGAGGALTSVLRFRRLVLNVQARRFLRCRGTWQ
jgi:hypothetical protein